MAGAYQDVECFFKEQNNELLATSLNTLRKEFKEHGHPEPSWTVLTLDGELARTTTTLCTHADVREDDVTIVERDVQTAEMLRQRVNKSTVVCSTVQDFACSADFRAGGYNVVYLDWMCTTTGNEKEGRPFKTLDDILARTGHSMIVFAQTFSMRGKVKGAGEGMSEQKVWERGADAAYESEKTLVCAELAELALRRNYLPLWNLHFESTYRRSAKSSWMLFMSVVLWRIPTADASPTLWSIYRTNQVDIKNRYGRGYTHDDPAYDTVYD